jgi:hypothetical protein
MGVPPKPLSPEEITYSSEPYSPFPVLRKEGAETLKQDFLRIEEYTFVAYKEYLTSLKNDGSISNREYDEFLSNYRTHLISIPLLITLLGV